MTRQPLARGFIGLDYADEMKGTLYIKPEWIAKVSGRVLTWEVGKHSYAALISPESARKAERYLNGQLSLFEEKK